MDWTRKLLALMLLLPAARALEVQVSAPAHVHQGESWEIRAFVTDGGGNVSYPSCTLSLYREGQGQGGYGMYSASGYAYRTMEFGSTGDWSATAYCSLGGNTNSSGLEFQVMPNSQLEVDVGGGEFVGDTLHVEADYEDYEGNDITTGSCTAYIYADGDYQQSRGLYYDSGRSSYYGTATIATDGSHSVDVECTASGYSDASDTASFETTSLPVTIQPLSTSAEGSYGSSAYITFSVSPATATCISSYGTTSHPSSGQWKVQVTLDFLGDKDVRLTCSAPEYTTSSRTVTFTSSERPTQMSVSFSTKEPHSFQHFRVTPQYYDSSWNQVQGASCTLTMGRESVQVGSFQAAEFEAPAGPVEVTLGLSCSKTGYKTFEGTTTFQVKPIPVSGELEFPDKAKKGEPFGVRVLLNPGVNADCTLEGELGSLDGGILQDYFEELNLRDLKEFTLVANESGTVSFGVSCALEGYTGFDESGEVLITSFSSSEEIDATIILTTLTLILAVCFMLVRRWF